MHLLFSDLDAPIFRAAASKNIFLNVARSWTVSKNKCNLVKFIIYQMKSDEDEFYIYTTLYSLRPRNKFVLDMI
jgi:hypothetical protein